MREKRFNLAHRLIHWAIALTVLFLLLTILLRLGWMSKDNMGTLVKESLDKSGIPASEKDAVSAAKNIRKSMWNYHILAGYVLIGFYVIRMIITAVQGIAYKNPFTKGLPGKEKFKSWLYIVFHVLIAVSLFTGFMVVNGPQDLKGTMESIHVKSLYYLVVFIILHLGGVFIADAGSDRGMISKMISGDNNRDTPN